MRFAFFLFFILCFRASLFSQQPTREQMQAQMKQAKAEALEQIKQMEADIGEAKKNGESPETISEMEKNLAMVKKMLGVIDKAASIQKPGPKNIEGVNSVSSYKSPYVRFFKEPVVIPTEAQAKDKLLWYKGKKINQNTLVTTKGRVIQYDRQNNRVLVQMNEKKDTSYLKIVTNLGKSRQWTQKYVNWKSAEKNSFFDYPLVMMAMKAYELIEKDFDKIANNSLDLPGTGTDPRAKIFREKEYGNSGPHDEMQRSTDHSIDPYIQQEYEEIMSRVNNAPPVDVYPPPKQEYSLCYYCDEAAQEKYYRDKEIWDNALNEFEAGIISRTLSIERYCQLMGLDLDAELGAQMSADLDRAGKFATDRMDQKIKMLNQRYGRDIYLFAGVVSATLSWERSKQLLGKADDNASPSNFDMFTSRIFPDFINQSIAANDYDVIFNYAMILSFARYRALLGYTEDDKDDYLTMIEAVVNKNRFALTLDMEFEFEMGEGDQLMLKANGTISTKQKIYLRLGRNNDCKWQFYLFDADYTLMTQENVYKLPLVVNGGSKSIKKGQAWETFPYSGPTDLLMPFPSFRISFCPATHQDSAYMEILRYEQENLPACNPAKAYCLDMLAYANKMIVSVSDTRAHEGSLVDIADQMVTVASSQAGITPTGYAKLDKMQADFNVNGKQHELQQRLTELSKVNNTILLFDAQNRSPFLINNTTNTANSELGLHIKKGIIKLKVVNEPL